MTYESANECAIERKGFKKKNEWRAYCFVTCFKSFQNLYDYRECHLSITKGVPTILHKLPLLSES